MIHQEDIRVTNSRLRVSLKFLSQSSGVRQVRGVHRMFPIPIQQLRCWFPSQWTEAEGFHEDGHRGRRRQIGEKLVQI